MADQVKIEMTSDVAKFEAAVLKLVTQQNKLENALRHTGRAGKQAGRDMGETFGKAAGDVAKFAAGLIGANSLGSAIQTVTGLFRDARAEVQGVATHLKSTYEGMKQLWQVSEGKADFEKLSATVKSAIAAEGISPERAMDLAFNLRSMGRDFALQAISQSGRFMDPAVAAKFFTTLSSEVNWGAAMSDPEKVLSGLIAGASGSKYNTAETADWMTRVAPALKGLGATPAEIMGVGGAISPATASPEILSTYMRTIGTEIEQAGFGGAGILEGFRRFRAEQPRLYAKTKRSETVFNTVASALEGALDDAVTLTSEVAAAMGSATLFGTKLDTPGEITLQRRLRTAEEQKKLALLPRAEKELELQISQARIKSVMALTGGALPVAEWMSDQMDTFATYGAVEQANERAGQWLINRIRERAPELYAEHLEGVFPMTSLQVGRTAWRGAGRELLGAPTSTPVYGPDYPRQPTGAQAEALDRAVTALVQATIEQRGATANLTEAVTRIHGGPTLDRPTGQWPQLLAAPGGWEE